MTCYYQSQPLISVLECCIIYSFAIGVTILECQQSTNSTQHYASVSNYQQLTYFNISTLTLFSKCI